jgi:hypothetical protein
LTCWPTRRSTGIALLAVGRSDLFKTRAAFSSGVFQLLLALAVAGDVGRRFLYGSEPKSPFMIGIGLLAICANLSCMALLQKHRHGEVHIHASWVFTKNDALANLGTVVGGILVWLTKTALPDLTLGLIICIVQIERLGRVGRIGRGEQRLNFVQRKVAPAVEHRDISADAHEAGVAAGTALVIDDEKYVASGGATVP